MRAVQITRFGGPEVLDVVELRDPVPGSGEELYEGTPAQKSVSDHCLRPNCAAAGS